MIGGTPYSILSVPQGYQYQWSNQDDNYWTLVQNPLGISVIMTDDDGCSQTISNNVGIKEQSGNDIFEIYPNPASEKFTIKGIKDNVMVSIYDVNNKLHLCNSVYSNNENIDINLLSAGIYILIISDDNSRSVKKLIKL